jgi:ribosomal protein L11 methyltransferase
MPETYWRAAVSVDEEVADGVTNFLWEAGAAGVVEEAAAEASRLLGFFPPGTDAGALRARVTGYLASLRGLGLTVGPGAVEVSPVGDEAWAEAWRAHFRPLPVGRRLLVCPPWEVPPRSPDGAGAGRIVLAIEPGRAFGTGSHATTRGCLELTEQALAGAPAGAALDVGTGSGILAIAAARLGVPRVLALDVDPDAVQAARENVRLNGVADRVGVEIGTPDEVTGGAHDLVLANLLGPTLITLAPVIGRVAAPRARLILGGLLVHEVPLVVASFVVERFALAEILEREGWASLLCVRGDPEGR